MNWSVILKYKQQPPINEGNGKMVDTDNNAGKIENGYSISTDVLKKAVEMKNVTNEEKVKKELIEETLRKVRKVMEERDLYDVELIHKILEHDLNRV